MYLLVKRADVAGETSNVDGYIVDGNFDKYGSWSKSTVLR